MNTPSPALHPHNAAAATGRRKRRTRAKKKIRFEEVEEVATTEDEKGEVEKKLAELQKIIPGGEWLTAEDLFEETAKYICELDRQAEALRFVAAFLQAMEKRKLGA